MQHKIVSRDEWLVARKAHLAHEKELTRLRDKLSAERRELPWVKVEKQYLFDSPRGKVSLADLFAGRSQLLVYHFMFGPAYEAGCPVCSSIADTLTPQVPHLKARETTPSTAEGLSFDPRRRE